VNDFPQLVLFDDQRARQWEPLCQTRSIGQLRFGALRLADRAARALGMEPGEILTDPLLAGLSAPGLPPCRAWSEAPSKGRRVFLSSRVALNANDVPDLPSQGILRVGGVVVGWVIPEHGPTPQPQDLLNPGRWLPAGSAVELPGLVLEWPWDLMERNAEQLRQDLVGAAIPELPNGVMVLGDGGVITESGVDIEPGVVLDCRSGPIHLASDVTVQAFTRLAGPSYIGTGSILLGGDISAVTIGQQSRIRGEVSTSVIGDFVNKAHDGHLGHAVVGDWVNLGAATTNSDLKNNYGPVRILLESGDTDTGRTKVGCLLGDHVKTGIGTLLPTGAVVGAGSNVFGGGLSPRRVPPFTWAGPAPHVPYELDRFLTNAAKAMARRKQELSAETRAVLSRLWEETRRT